MLTHNRAPRPQTRLDVRGAVVASSAAAAVYLAALVSNMQLPRGFSAVLFTVTTTCALAATALLGMRANAEDDEPLRWATAGLAVACAAMVLQLISFPAVSGGGGIFASDGISSALEYLAWHLAPACGMLLGALGCPARWRRWLVAAGLLLVGLAARPGWPLPLLVRADGSFTRLLVALELAAAVATALVAAVWYRWSGRRPTATQGWLTVTLVLSCYDLLLNALASKRFEPIWWASLFTRSLTYAVLLGGLIAATARQLVRVEAYVDAELGRAESVARSSLAVAQRLLATAQALAGSVTVREVADSAARTALDAAELTSAQLLAFDETGRALEVLASAGPTPRLGGVDGRVPLDPTQPPGAVLAGGEPLFCRTRQEVDAKLGAALADPGVAVASLAALPLPVGGQPVGALLLWGSAPHRFGQLERELLTGIANQAGQALVRARLYEQQRSVAETLQRGLLPDLLPDRPEVRLAGRYVPGGGGAEIGGDWYDAMELADGRLLLVVGDVMGKGAGAAHMMSQVRAAVRAFALLDPEPVAVLAGLDRMMAGFGPEQFVTIGCALLDPPGGRVTLARAGHLPVLVAAPGEPPWFCESDAGPPLGAPEPHRHQTDLVLPAGALLALYSDGLVEDRIAGLERGLAGLLESAAARGDDDLEALADRMLGGRPRLGDDDVTLLLAEVGAATAEAVAAPQPAGGSGTTYGVW